MKTSDLQPVELGPQRRRFRWTLRILAVLALLSALLVAGLVVGNLSFRRSYDNERYAQIKNTIDAAPGHLLGKSLEEIAQELNLEGVPYDQVSEPQGMWFEETRIYHFRGFACYVTVSWLPPDVTPDGMHLASSSQPASPRQGQLPLTIRPPGAAIDGFSTPKERMEHYWRREHDAVEQIRRGAARADDKANKP